VVTCNAVARGKAEVVFQIKVGDITEPKTSDSGTGWFVRAEICDGSTGPKKLELSDETVRDYFYSANFYAVLGVKESATLADLRIAWRMKRVETDGIAQAEKAFDILAHHELRKCYGAFRLDETAPLLFPYAGSGTIVVEGRSSGDDAAFFANRILGYKPDLTAKRVAVLLAIANSSRIA